MYIIYYVYVCMYVHVIIMMASFNNNIDSVCSYTAIKTRIYGAKGKGID